MGNKIEKLELRKIRLDGGTQPRSELNEAVVIDYAERMMDGATFPPVVVVRDGHNDWLVDGFHRVEAAQRAGRADITCEVRYGSQEDAQWQCLSSNATHGERRSRADTSRAVDLALKHGHAAKLSDSQIADHIGVSASTVLRHRKKLESTCALHKLPERLGKDGKLRKLPRSDSLEEPSYAAALRIIAARESYPASGNDLKLPPLESGMVYLAVGEENYPAVVAPAPERPEGWLAWATLHGGCYYTLRVVNEDIVRHFLNGVPFLAIEKWDALPWDGTLLSCFQSEEDRWIESALHDKFESDKGRRSRDGEVYKALEALETIRGNATQSRYQLCMEYIRNIKWE